MTEEIDHQAIAAANRRFYAKAAETYEATETCVVDSRRQALLERQIDDVLQLLGNWSLETTIALDACGGSGNVSLKLLRRGVKVVNVDVSPEMLQIFRRKLAEAGHHADVVESEVADYLRRTQYSFDIVVFSSALHHLKDLEALMVLVFARLRPGGVLLTSFDPTLRSRLNWWSRIVIWLDYVWFKLTQQTGDFLRAAMRRLRRSIGGDRGATSNEAFDGVLAEYRARTGIDDLSLEAFLERIGFEIVRHLRVAEARFTGCRWLLKALAEATEFSILARKPFGPPIERPPLPLDR